MKNISTNIIFILFFIGSSLHAIQAKGYEDRQYWVNMLTKIADPVLTNLSNNTLKKNMPYESLGDRKEFSYLEAVGRLMCGIAPWLELGPDDTEEGLLRKKYIDLTLKGLENAVDPEAPDYLLFGKPYQPLVDAAFLAEGLLRAKTQVWDKLDKKVQDNVITELKRTRSITPWNNNWLLFASTIEAALLDFTGECDMNRLTHGVKMFRDEWYKGDALYGDGPAFHMDYYNSFVIHPMLTDVLTIMKKYNLDDSDFYNIQSSRLARYADQLERFISPEGTYPIVGRSIVYRMGVFHALSQACLMQILPEHIKPAQVRCALTAVMKNQMKSSFNFDKDGWLKIGFTGNQINMSESYINTGSLYLCSAVFLPLGLPDSDTFWAETYTEWTNKKGWSGEEVKRDAALK